MSTTEAESLEQFLDSCYLRYSTIPQATIDPLQIQFDDHFDSTRLVKDPLVTVKVMTYGQEKLLPRALDHVLRQSVDFPFEIIVSDDCSPDNTPVVVGRYLQQFPQTIRYTRTHRNETGKINGRIAELLARGKYMAICEGDDYWHDPQKLQTQVDILEKNPDCVVVHSSVRNDRGPDSTAEPSTRRKPNMPAGPTMDVTIPYLKRAYGVHNCSCMYRRESLECAIREVRPLIDSTQFIHGDVPRFLGLSRLGGFYFLNQELATYQVNQESLSQSKEWRRRIAIRMSSTMIRVWYARLYLGDERLADSLLQEFWHWLYHSSDRAASNWARQKLDQANNDLSIVRQILKPVNRLQRAIWRRWKRRSW